MSGLHGNAFHAGCRFAALAGMLLAVLAIDAAADSPGRSPMASFGLLKGIS